MNDRDALQYLSLELFGDGSYSNREVLEEVKRINEEYWNQEEIRYLMNTLMNTRNQLDAAIEALEKLCQ